MAGAGGSPDARDPPLSGGAARVPQHDTPIVHGDAAASPDNPTRARRLDWAALLKRCFAVDVLVCPSCRGPMHILAFIDDERLARRILAHLGLPSRAPPRPPPSGQPLLPLAARPDLEGID